MSIDPELRTRVKTVFVGLNRIGANDAFSEPATLSRTLEKLIPPTDMDAVDVVPRVATFFATASVDMWLRAVHSLLVSASLTNASPIWASVSGYYASHYAVRGLAHLLGYFLLFTRKRIVQLSHQNGRHYCSFTKRSADDREHKLYWKRVHADPHFQDDPFFSENKVRSDASKAGGGALTAGNDASDVRHRDHANYADSLFPYPQFRTLDEATLKNRMSIISQIEVTDPPIPRISEFADLDNVQLVAYHRIVRYRQFLDEVLADDSRFWKVHRNPSFAASVLNFQVTARSGLSILDPR